MWHVSEAVRWEKKEKQAAHAFGVFGCLQMSVKEAAWFRNQIEMADVWYQRQVNTWMWL